MSSAAIVSARLTTLTHLCCHCRLHQRFDIVFALAVLIVFIAVWRHCCHYHRCCPCSPCPATAALAAFVVTLAVVATTSLAIEVALVVDCCVPLPLEEDHSLSSPSGKVPPWPLSS